MGEGGGGGKQSYIVVALLHMLEYSELRPSQLVGVPPIHCHLEFNYW